jgi:ribosomal-protein-alanine N-acetyltransferase
VGAPEPLASGWHVAPATRADLRALAALGVESLARGWSAPALEAELARADGWAFALRAETSGAPLGLLLASRVADELHVLLVVVSPAQRRRGGGGALVEAALAAARAAGVAVVHLEVRAGNVAALALYARHGFLAVGRRPRYYEGREDAVLMSRRLEGGAAA